MTRVASAAGVTLVELLVALTISTLLAASLVALLAPIWRLAASAPGTADAYQRLRVATDTLLGDLRAAGAVTAAADGGGVTIQFAAVMRTYVLDGTTVRRRDDAGPAWPVVDDVEALAVQVGLPWVRVGLRLVRPPDRVDSGVGPGGLWVAATPRAGSDP